MTGRLKDRVAVVTGSGQGIGRAIAIALAREGAKVVTNNRKQGSTGAFVYGDEFEKSLRVEQREWTHKKYSETQGDAETVVKEIKDMGGDAVPFFGDISSFEVAGRLIKTAIDNFGKIDILVNNAGTAMRVPIWEMSEEQWDHVSSNKPKGAFNTIRHAVPFMMKQKWGRIINCTSSAALGTLEHCSYSAANAGVVGLTMAVSKELLPYGITCNAYDPGAMTRIVYNLYVRQWRAAEMGDANISEETLENIHKIKDTRRGAEYIAPFVAYLATENAGNISGTVFSMRAENSVYGIYSVPTVTKTIEKKNGLWTVDELIDQVPKVLLEGYQNMRAANPVT